MRPGEDMHGAQVRGVSVSSVRTAGQLLFYFVKCNCANIPRRDQVEENSPEPDTIQTETYFHSQLLTKNDLIPLNGNQE